MLRMNFGTHLSFFNVFSRETRRLLRRSLRLPKRKWAQGQAGL